MKQATRAKIEAFHYHEMYNSPACWTTTKMIDDELKQLKSNASKIKSLKTNIKIRLIGFGWNDLHTPWSRDGNHLSVHLFTTHLKKY